LVLLFFLGFQNLSGILQKRPFPRDIFLSAFCVENDAGKLFYCGQLFLFFPV